MAYFAEQGVILRVEFQGRWASWTVALPYVCASGPIVAGQVGADFSHFITTQFWSAWREANPGSIEIRQASVNAMVAGTIIPWRETWIGFAMPGLLPGQETTWIITSTGVYYSIEQMADDGHLAKANHFWGPIPQGEENASNRMTPTYVAKLQTFMDGIDIFAGSASGNTWRRALSARDDAGDVIYHVTNWYARSQTFTRRFRGHGNF